MDGCAREGEKLVFRGKPSSASRRDRPTLHTADRAMLGTCSIGPPLFRSACDLFGRRITAAWKTVLATGTASLCGRFHVKRLRNARRHQAMPRRELPLRSASIVTVGAVACAASSARRPGRRRSSSGLETALPLLTSSTSLARPTEACRFAVELGCLQALLEIVSSVTNTPSGVKSSHIAARGARTKGARA